MSHGEFYNPSNPARLLVLKKTRVGDLLINKAGAVRALTLLLAALALLGLAFPLLSPRSIINNPAAGEAPTFILTAIELVSFLIVGLALLQVMVLFHTSLQRQAFEREQQRLALDAWQQRIAAAALPASEKKATDLFWKGTRSFVVLKKDRRQKDWRGQDHSGHISWQGTRKFVVSKKVQESANICSFYLVPHDQLPLPPFKPGQYLSFAMRIPDQERPITRCYSLSDSPGQDYYRVTVKRQIFGSGSTDSRPGLVSNYFHDHIHEGDVVDVKAPSGRFFLDVQQGTPVVLIGGGCGITPLLSMVNAIAESGTKRETWLFYGVHNGREHIMKDHLARLAREHANIHLQVCYSRPAKDDAQGLDYHHAQRISVDLLKSVLPGSHYDFYICGPSAMMQILSEGLEAWGVPLQHIHYEAFAPRSSKQMETAMPSGDAGIQGVEVHFARSGIRKTWTPESGTLLDFAEKHGVALEYSCRLGDCGNCLTRIRSGKVSYAQLPGAIPEAGSCLACVAIPESDLVLDA